MWKSISATPVLLIAKGQHELLQDWYEWEYTSQNPSRIRIMKKNLKNNLCLQHWSIWNYGYHFLSCFYKLHIGVVFSAATLLIPLLNSCFYCHRSSKVYKGMGGGGGGGEWHHPKQGSSHLWAKLRRQHAPPPCSPWGQNPDTPLHRSNALYVDIVTKKEDRGFTKIPDILHSAERPFKSANTPNPCIGSALHHLPLSIR